MLLQPKNWAVFQHYKDRCPPWIKLHRDLLNDRVYMCLPLASKALAPLLWLLASESKDGIFDGSMDELAFRLHITPKEYDEGIKPLIHKGFFVVASGVLADSYQDAIPETETEVEKKKETKKKATVVARPDSVDEQLWNDWLVIRKKKDAPLTQTAWELFLNQVTKAGWTVEDAIKECCLRTWASFKAEWVQPKQSFAQQAADVARTTVPGPTGRDPVLVKMEQERSKAVPPTVEQLEKMAALRRSIAK